MRNYPEIAMEKAMTRQEIILRAYAKKINWIEAADILGLSYRHLGRIKAKYEEVGIDGLFDGRVGKESPRRVPVGEVEEVLRLYREKYFDFNVRHFHEKLSEDHDICFSYTWVKNLLQKSGLVARSGKRKKHRKRRERKPLVGMMLHIDGSEHQWFGDGRYFDLIVILDDATSEIYYAQLVNEESTRTVMEAIREVIRGIKTIEEANRFLKSYVREFNRKFATQAAEPDQTAFVPCMRNDLDLVFSVHSERTVNRDNTIKYKNLTLQIEKQSWRRSMDGCRVTVYQHLDGHISIGYGPQQIGSYTAQGELRNKNSSGRPRNKKAVEMPLPRKTAKDAVSLSSLENFRQKTPQVSHIPTASAATG